MPPTFTSHNTCHNLFACDYGGSSNCTPPFSIISSIVIGYIG